MLKSLSPGSNNTVENVLIKYNGRSSITKIKKTINTSLSFHFSTEETADSEKEIRVLNCSKVGTCQNIPVKYCKEVSNMCSSTL